MPLVPEASDRSYWKEELLMSPQNKSLMEPAFQALDVKQNQKSAYQNK